MLSQKRGMGEKISLNNIIDILNSDIELYYKGSLVGVFTKEELKESEWINDRVIGIETDEVSTLCVYLSDCNRAY